MQYFIIIVVVLIALSPLISMRPSPRKLKQAKMRQAAYGRGMQVMFCDMPGGGEPVKGIAYRLLRRDRKQKKRDRMGSYLRTADQWTSSQQVSDQLVATLVKLPESVSAVSIESNGCSVYWHEAGDLADVEKIYDVLSELLAI